MIIIINSKSTNHISNYTFLCKYFKLLKQLRKKYFKTVWDNVSNILTLVLWSVCVWKSLRCVWLFLTPWAISPPGSSVHGILQARILKWDLPDPGIKPRSPALQAESLSFESLYYINVNFLKVKFSSHFLFLMLIQCLVSLSQKWDFQWLLSGFNSALELNQEAYVKTIKKTSFGRTQITKTSLTDFSLILLVLKN